MLTDTVVQGFAKTLLALLQKYYPEGIDPRFADAKDKQNRVIALAMGGVTGLTRQDDDLRRLWHAATVWLQDGKTERPFLLSQDFRTGAMDTQWDHFKLQFGPNMGL